MPPDELPGSMTEFLRVVSFLVATAPLLLFISEISPTLGNALEFLQFHQKGAIAQRCAHPLFG